MLEGKKKGGGGIQYRTSSKHMKINSLRFGKALDVNDVIFLLVDFHIILLPIFIRFDMIILMYHKDHICLYCGDLNVVICSQIPSF